MLEVEAYQTKPNPTHGFGRIRGFLIKDETEVETHYVVNPATKIFVRSNYEPNPESVGGGDRIAFSEKHEAHEGGEAYVAGANPVNVALTPRVVEALNDLQIVESTKEEVEAYQTETLNRVKNYIASKKAEYKEKYIALIGNDKNFEAAWQEMQAKEAILYIEK